MTTKQLALDIGNVLCHVDFNRILNNLSKTLNISKNEAMYFLNRVQKLHDLGLTNLSDELKDYFKIRSEIVVEDILAEWNRAIQWDNDVIKQVARLKDKFDLEIALVSNIGIEHAAHLRNTVPDPVIGKAIHFFSCEVGARKPSALYYKTFLDMYPQFKECVYIDDLEENLNVGRKFGLNAIRFNLSDFKRSSLNNLLIGGSKISTFFTGLDNHFKS